MPATKPYQPLLLRLLHGMNGLLVIGAILTAVWTYDTYDGRWGRLPLPSFPEIEGIHGTFGMFALIFFPAFVLYAFHRGQHRLIQGNSTQELARQKSSKIGTPRWWYNVHRLVNTIILLALTFAFFSGKMMDSTWLPQGELNHAWYYGHLISWAIVVTCILLHGLISAKVGGIPLLLSIVSWRFRAQDSPTLWGKQIQAWGSKWLPLQRLLQPGIFPLMEILIFIALIAAWLIPLVQ